MSEKMKEKDEMVTAKMVSTLFSEGLKTADNIGANVIDAVVKTVKENKLAVTATMIGLTANGLAKAFDLDSPLSVIGQEGLGLDAFVDNAGDLLILGGGVKLSADLTMNVKEALFNPLADEELLRKYAKKSGIFNSGLDSTEE